MTASEFEAVPARHSATAAVAVAALAMAVIALSHPVMTLLAAAGVAVLAGGAFRGVRWAVTVGAAIVFVGNLLAATAGPSTPPFVALLAGALAVVAWDLGEHAISLGEDVGGAARTAQGELVHAALTLGVAMFAVALGYAIFRVGADGRPVLAIVFLVVGSFILFRTLRPD